VRGTILAKELSGERFFRYRVVCPENGRMDCLWRRSQKMSGGGPDIFDQVALSLESSSAFGTWFIKEYRTEMTRGGLARRYQNLKLATRLSDLIWKNLQHAEFFEPATRLLDEALRAFESSTLPHCVYLKAVYRLAQDEGYAVRQQWIAGLSPQRTEHVRQIIPLPLSEISPAMEAEAPALTRSFERWLCGETDIVVPK